MRSAAVSMMALVASASSAATIPFGPGEQISYQVSFMGVPSGVAQITVGLRTEHHGKNVVCVGKTTLPTSLFQINDRFVSYYDPSQHLPVALDFFVEEGRDRRKEKFHFDRDAARIFAHKKRDGQQPYDVDYELNAGVTDLASAAFRLRAQPLKVGEVFELPIFTGAKSYVMRVTVEGKQTLSTRLGELPVHRLSVTTDFQGNAKTKGNVSIFVSADEKQLPVRIQADFVVGSATADIVQYLPGSSTL
jgi:hypothetical protein